MTPALERWNRLSEAEASAEILACCASRAWARCVAGGRPFADAGALLRASDGCWALTSEEDRSEAYAAHPRIGGHAAGAAAFEQSGVEGASRETLDALADANRRYEERFGRIFLVCAAGKNADEMLALCRERLQNDRRVELSICAEEQRKITASRLERWLAS